MGIIQSFIRIKFNHYRTIARAIVPPSREITSLQKTFCDLPGSTVSKLKELHSEVFLKVNLGRLLVFLKFAEDLELTQEEWGQLYAVIYPTLISQIWEQLYKAMMSAVKSLKTLNIAKWLERWVVVHHRPRLDIVSQLIMRVRKPTVAYKLVQLCRKNPKREPSSDLLL